MTTQVHNKPAVDVSAARSIRPDEVEALRECIKGVQSGETEYQVLLTNRKQTKSRKRLPGEHYDPHPALKPTAHKGWLVAAPLNKHGRVYLHIYDEARAREQGHGFGHTRVTLQGLRSFEVLNTRPGPLAKPAAAPPPPPFTDPRMLMAAALFAQAQAGLLMGQALMLQAQQKPL